MAKIVCVGIGVTDHIFRVQDLPGGHGKFFAQSYAHAAGGPGAVASIAAAAMGHEAQFFGRIGDDDTGHALLDVLSSRGVDASGCRLISGEHTPVSAVIVDNEGERMIVNHGNPNLDTDPAWLPEDVIASADVLLVDVRWPEGAIRALDIANKAGVPTVVDADMAPYSTAPIIDHARDAVFSEGGLELYTGEADPWEALKLAAEKVDNVAVTLGGKGTLWLEGGEIKHLPAFKINVVDTLGAGDTFHGAYAAALAEGKTMPERLRFASAVAALKCMVPGGSKGIPTREAVEQFLAEHP